MLNRKHQEGWVTDPRRNRQLEYRLTINRAKKEDEGTYTCSTPKKREHSVSIVVNSKFNYFSLTYFIASTITNALIFNNLTRF